MTPGPRPTRPCTAALPRTLALLKRLVDDPPLNLRHSMTHHVNDLSTDHPNLAAHVGWPWMEGASKQRAEWRDTRFAR